MINFKGSQFERELIWWGGDGTSRTRFLTGNLKK
jgi:hypothetical protein